MSTETNVAISDDSAWQGWLSWSLEASIGAIMLVAGISKALDIVDSVKQAAAYQIITNPAVLTVLVWVLIASEFAIGAALLTGFQRRIFVPFTFALMAIFLGALGWAWANGSTANCGCFGKWVNHTPQQALIIDVALLAGLIVAQFLPRKPATTNQALRLGAVVLSVIVGLGLTGWASTRPSQSSDPVTRLQASEENILSNVKINGITFDISKGNHLLAIIDTGCDHCQANVPNFNQLFEQQANLAPFAAVCPNNEVELKYFKDKFKPSFPIGFISNDDFLKLLKGGDTPRTILVRDGKPLKIWDGHAPPQEEVKAALAN